MTESRTRRLFFALWPSIALREDIERSVNSALRFDQGRRIPKDNFHVTLAFLGAVPEQQLSALLKLKCAIEVPPFEFTLDQLAWWKRQSLVCLEPAEQPESLVSLATRVQDSARAMGFAIEGREFRAHVSIARDVRQTPELKPIKSLRWQVQRVELVESKPSSSGSAYSLLSTSPVS